MEKSIFENMGKLYERAGQELARALPPGWKTAWCQVEMAEDYGSVNCFYVGEGTPQPAYARAPSELTDTFKEIWDESPEPPWTTATFVLHAGGKFNIDYGYDPIPLDESFDRRAAWKKKHLPQ